MHSTVYMYSRFSCIDRVKMLSYYFLSDLIVKNMSLFMKFYKKIVAIWRQRSCDTRFRRYASIEDIPLADLIKPWNLLLSALVYDLYYLT